MLISLLDGNSSETNCHFGESADVPNEMAADEQVVHQTDLNQPSSSDTAMRSLGKSPSTVSFNDGFHKLMGGKQGAGNLSEVLEVRHGILCFS